MPMPWTYRHAQKEFASILARTKDEMGSALLSDNMTYTAIEGVLRCFRARLTPEQVIAFGDVLPSILRAILVHQWDVTEAPRPFGTRAGMTKEVQAHRQHHNIATDDCIEAFAIALWSHSNHRDLEHVLAKIGPEAEDFWTVTRYDLSELQPKII